LTTTITLIFTTATLISQILIFVFLLFFLFKVILKRKINLKLPRIKTSLTFSSLALITVSVSTLVSLYYSEIANFYPCKLCWIERIAMFPLFPLLLIGSIGKEKLFLKWTPVFSITGFLISGYHYLLQINLSNAEICSSEITCTEKWIWEYGYISIPMMGLTAFGIITILSIYGYWIKNEI
tara:strand:+ start:1402 stop:1944 length:543 start_codon:yes stop_codon:yes gene_type:complete